MYIIDQEQEKKEILRRYRILLSAWKIKSDKDKRLVRKAFNFAVEAHKDMRRKSGEPYVYHPLEVARICVQEIGLGTTSIISALLHDVVEDTDYTLHDIEVIFGARVALIIDGLTKVSDFVNTKSNSLQAENFLKILLTLSSDVRVILIKLADRLHNMRTLDFLAPEKRLKIASETAFFFAPLAHRLGLFPIKTELEDLALKQIEPEFYHSVEKKIKETEEERLRFFNKFIYPIKKDFHEEGLDCTISPRIKSVYSIWNRVKDRELSLEEIFNRHTIRIIIDTPPLKDKEKVDCWRAYTIITRHYTPKPELIKDWISVPKTNGYQALHITVMGLSGKWVEVQICTRRMDEIAERGYAAMYKYKESDTFENAVEEWIRKAKDLLEGNLDSSAEELVDDFKLDLFRDQILVFTPKGAGVKLPAGSTILDFAYNIHTNLGNQCIGGKVNNRPMNRDHKLKNGDQIEVISSPSQKPKTEWLDHVVSARAKTSIREALKLEKQEICQKGKSLLDKHLEEAGLPLNNEIISSLFKIKEPDDIEELYYQIGIEAIGEGEIKNILSTKSKESLFDFFKRPFIKIKGNGGSSISNQIREKIRKNPGSLLLPETVEELKTEIASCCHPIPGDDVIGLLSKKNTIEIHRTTCKEAMDFMSKFGDKIIKAKWKEGKEVGFLAGVRIHSTDRKGMIADITKVISEDFNLNMRSFHMETSGDISKGIIMVYVKDIKNLNDIMAGLRKVQGIMLVNRITNLESKNPMS
ncbi:MAG: bifunctional (p)ppGpp synthetase/guanosine-3',5'-bis(diphosphate) 3'-pyrophosphohydrolase [Bacteroidales bacterium]